jgi:DNA-binding NtrC family response regulator
MLHTDTTNKQPFLFVDPQSAKIFSLACRVAVSTIPVLISGPTGSGKEILAKVVHEASPQSSGPFVAVNCAAIPATLAESLFFGHEKGSFTSAIKQRLGKFEQANGGTLFLDEIGDMDASAQAQVLRALQEGKITRVGGEKEISVDIRVIAATNKNLAQRVKDGKMREDLYYRLQGFLIHLPPLRERENDLLLLAKNMLKQFCESNRIPVKSFSSESLKAMMKHPWSGNVRELKAFVERAVLISDEDIIHEEDLIFSQDI